MFNRLIELAQAGQHPYILCTGTKLIYVPTERRNFVQYLQLKGIPHKLNGVIPIVNGCAIYFTSVEHV